jgi:hypothetical protein
MGKMTKLLLVLALMGLGSGLIFASGLVQVKDLPGLYATLPVGAICFGLFLISLMLEKESALFDEEHSRSEPSQPKAGSPPRRHHWVSTKAT